MSPTLYFVLILAFIPIMFYVLYCVVKMFLNVVEGRLKIIALLPTGLIDSTLYNEKGNKYRKRVLYINAAGLILILFLFIFK